MLQFQISDLFGVLVKLHGMAIPEEQGIRLAFHDADQLGKRLDARVESVLLTYDNLVGLTVDTGLLGDQLLITVHSTKPLEHFPNVEKQTLKLETRKQDRDVVKAFVAEVDRFRQGHHEQNVDEMLDDIRDFLHGS